jgi:hypothetical protein
MSVKFSVLAGNGPAKHHHHHHPKGTTMNRTDYLAAINAPGVNVVKVGWTSEVKPAAAHKGKSLVKYVEAMAQTGVEYANLSANNDRETGSLPWGEWAEYPYVVTHKGRDYARLYLVDGTLRTAYVVDDRLVSRDEFLSYLTPSQRESRRSVGGTVTVKMDALYVL